jgi:hypothetical protein
MANFGMQKENLSAECNRDEARHQQEIERVTPLNTCVVCGSRAQFVDDDETTGQKKGFCSSCMKTRDRVRRTDRYHTSGMLSSKGLFKEKCRSCGHSLAQHHNGVCSACGGELCLG